MFYGEEVIILEPSKDDMWKSTFIGYYCGEEGSSAVIADKNNFIFKVPMNKIKRPAAIDYVTVGLS